MSRNRNYAPRYPGDADPNQWTLAREREYAARTIARYKSLQTLIRNGYVGEITAEPSYRQRVTLYGPSSPGPAPYLQINVGKGTFVAADAGEFSPGATTNLRAAVRLYRLMIDWDEGNPAWEKKFFKALQDARGPG